MDFEKSTALLLGRMVGFAHKTGFDIDKAKIFASDALNRGRLKLEMDAEFKKRALKESRFFENYVFRSLINSIINEKRRIRKLDPLKTKENGEILCPAQDTLDPEKIFMEAQKQAVIKDYIEKLAEICNVEEKQFLGVFLSLAEESGKVNLSKAGRLLGLTADQSHNLMKKIERKAKYLEAKEKMLENVSTAQVVFSSLLQNFFTNLFIENPEEEITPDSLEMAKSFIQTLTLPEIDLLSKVL